MCKDWKFEAETMSKPFTQNLTRFLLITIAFSSGCTQSIVIDSLTPIPIILTVTPIDCVSSPKTPSLDIEKTAGEWFLAPRSMIVARDEYIPFGGWDGFCSRYQNAIINKEYWVSAPIEIALNIINLPHPEDAFPTSIYAVTTKFDNIMIVMIQQTQIADDSVEARETRLDLIKIDGLWQLYWGGYRLRCYRPYDQPHDWIKQPCS